MKLFVLAYTIVILLLELGCISLTAYSNREVKIKKTIEAGRTLEFGDGLFDVETDTILESAYGIPNKIYTITSKIDLNGKTVNIASGCCLNFEGGSFTNGTLVGNNTRIIALFGKIFSTSVKLEGTFNSDRIVMSWWGTRGIYENTEEVQCALNSILKFSNRLFVFDMPVRITDVSFTLKWSPGVKFIGFSNSNQNDLAITVFGKDSQGFDISGTENLRFENLLFRGDEKYPPRTLLFASRYKENKQCPGHRFQDVSFCGKVTISQVYNYSGESWYFENCKFSIDRTSRCEAVYYATTINSKKLISKFGSIETNITPLTYSSFCRCFFMNSTECPSIIFEGARNSSGKLRNVASVLFDKCYFYTPKSTTARFINPYGSITFMNSIDESGADSNSDGSKPFYEFSGNCLMQGLIFFNNTIYTRKNSSIIEATVPVRNYNAQSNYIINGNGTWRFSKLYDSRHLDLSPIERIEVEGDNKNVVIEGGNASNIKIKR